MISLYKRVSISVPLSRNEGNYQFHHIKSITNGIVLNTHTYMCVPHMFRQKKFGKIKNQKKISSVERHQCEWKTFYRDLTRMIRLFPFFVFHCRRHSCVRAYVDHLLSSQIILCPFFLISFPPEHQHNSQSPTHTSGIFSYAGSRT